MHGGKSLYGFASPTYKHGLYSRDFLTRLGAFYELAPELVGHLMYLPEKEAVRVALAYKNEGRVAAYGLMTELTIKRLAGRYGSFEAACAAILGPARRSR